MMLAVRFSEPLKVSVPNVTSSDGLVVQAATHGGGKPSPHGTQGSADIVDAPKPASTILFSKLEYFQRINAYVFV